MINSKNKISCAILIFTILLSMFNKARSQDSANQPNNLPLPPIGVQQNPIAKKKKRFHFFWQNEQKERYKQELENLKNRQKLETEDLKKKQEAEKAREVILQKKVMEKQTENMLIAKKTIEDRTKEIEEIKHSNNTVEVISSKEDPLYIKKAEVLNTKTKFMEIKDVDFNYKLELHNQTPKIINFALIIWERRLPFNNTQTLAKEVQVAKPITPYEKRIVEYNELDSKRNGETYKVRVVKIVFEDGTQWKNPAVKDAKL